MSVLWLLLLWPISGGVIFSYLHVGDEFTVLDMFGLISFCIAGPIVLLMFGFFKFLEWADGAVLWRR